MENLSATPLRAPRRGGRSITILVAADVLNYQGDDFELSRIIVNDFVKRDEYGYNKYNQNLETNDGRPTDWDLYQELLDACQYARKDMEEGGTVGVLVYGHLLDMTRVARREIMKSAEREDALDWGDAHDSEKERHDRATTEARPFAAERNRQELLTGELSRSGQRSMDTD